jgi:hypothetical protein
MDSYTQLAMAKLLNRDRVDADRVGQALRDYGSRFRQWDDRASVRTSPQRLILPGAAQDLYFPPELVPVATHPVVSARGSQIVRSLLVQRLYQYLHFTVELEALAVIPVAMKISRGRMGVDLPAEVRADAFRIVTDEAWHAQFSFDLIRQVEQRTGVPCQPGIPPMFVARLDEIRPHLDPRVRGLEALLFAIVSETLISTILTDLPTDRRLPVAVREVVSDHAKDEGRHHAYFRDLLLKIWPALDPADTAAIGPWLPMMIRAFLEPDRGALATLVRAAGLTEEEVRGVIEESLPPELVDAQVASGAQAAVQYFTMVGALDHAPTREAFELASLLSRAVRSGRADTIRDRQ